MFGCKAIKNIFVASKDGSIFLIKFKLRKEMSEDSENGPKFLKIC